MGNLNIPVYYNQQIPEVPQMAQYPTGEVHGLETLAGQIERTGHSVHNFFQTIQEIENDDGLADARLEYRKQVSAGIAALKMNFTDPQSFVNGADKVHEEARKDIAPMLQGNQKALAKFMQDTHSYQMEQEPDHWSYASKMYLDKKQLEEEDRLDEWKQQIVEADSKDQPRIYKEVEQYLFSRIGRTRNQMDVHRRFEKFREDVAEEAINKLALKDPKSALDAANSGAIKFLTSKRQRQIIEQLETRYKMHREQVTQDIAEEKKVEQGLHDAGVQQIENDLTKRIILGNQAGNPNIKPISLTELTSMLTGEGIDVQIDQAAAATQGVKPYKLPKPQTVTIRMDSKEAIAMMERVKKAQEIVLPKQDLPEEYGIISENIRLNLYPVKEIEKQIETSVLLKGSSKEALYNKLYSDQARDIDKKIASVSRAIGAQLVKNYDSQQARTPEDSDRFTRCIEELEVWVRNELKTGRNPTPHEIYIQGYEKIMPGYRPTPAQRVKEETDRMKMETIERKIIEKGGKLPLRKPGQTPEQWLEENRKELGI